MKIAVLVTCFNRVSTTLKGVRSLVEGLSRIGDLQFEIFLVDDGSRDGTGEAVAKEFPQVHVIQGTGQLFWNGGMCRAYEVARQHSSFDAYLLFNDDVEIIADRVASFFSEYGRLNAATPSILVGATVASDLTTVTYSGTVEHSTLRPRDFRRVALAGTTRCDTFNGNFVLVPGSFFEQIGGLDRRYKHAFGDTALGLTARRQGLKSFVHGDPIGICDANVAIRAAGDQSIAARRKIVGHPAYSFADFQTFVLEFRPKAMFPIYWLAFLLKRESYVLLAIGSYGSA